MVKHGACVISPCGEMSVRERYTHSAYIHIYIMLNVIVLARENKTHIRSPSKEEQYGSIWVKSGSQCARKSVLACHFGDV